MSKCNNADDHINEEKEVYEEVNEADAASEDVENAEDVENVENAENVEEGKGEKSKSKLFSKKEKKDKKDEKIEELNDRLMRLMAEYDNYRKRTEKEKSAMFDMGARTIVEKVIPVVDNFERGFDTVSEEDKENPFIMGMDKVYKQLMTTLEEAGVKVIEAAGQEFDPNLHNAVMHVDDESLGENVVAEELQKGYMYKDSVVRYSMVKVAN